MNFPRLAALLLATTLVTGSALAQEDPASDPALAQQDAELPQDLATLLTDGRQAEELSDAELAERFRLAREYMQQDGLPKKIRKRLIELAKGDQRELHRRSQAGEQQNAEQPQSTEAPAIAEGDCGAEGTMGSSARADDPEEITPDTTSSARMTRIPSRRLMRTCTTAPPSKVPSGMLGPVTPSWRGVNSYRHASRNC